MIELRAMRPEDVDGFRPHAVHAASLAAIPDAMERLRSAPERGPSWTACEAGEVMGFGGLIDNGDRTASAWLLLSMAAPARAWIAIHRHARRLLKQAEVHVGFAVVDASVRSNWPAGERLARLLDFHRSERGSTAEFTTWERRAA